MSPNEDHELEENFLSHGVHVDIKDDVDSMEPFSQNRIGKRPRQLVSTTTGWIKKTKTLEWVW